MGRLSQRLLGQSTNFGGVLLTGNVVSFRGVQRIALEEVPQFHGGDVVQRGAHA